MAGLTRPIIDQINAQSSEENTELVVQGEKLALTQPNEAPISEIERGFFDPIFGTLVFRLRNGQQVKVNGFPTADKIPVGPTGPAGPRGQDGKPGKPGKNGMQGEQGCEGPQGERGQQGPPGPDGRRGMQGPPGIRGMTGPRGPVGLTGPTGDIGPVGPTGPRGEPGPEGPAGQPGPDGSTNIIVSTSDPGAVGGGTLWVNPNGNTPSGGGDGGELTDPPVGTPWP